MLVEHAAFNTSLLQYLACPLSKDPLRYYEKSQELVNDSLGVAYPIIDGIACLVPSRGRLVEKLPEDPEPDPAAGR
jgi:uncharacterized protein YbaR (Trm112 family)